MKISLIEVNSEEVIRPFLEQEDLMIDFLGDDSVYYNRYRKNNIYKILG